MTLRMSLVLAEYRKLSKHACQKCTRNCLRPAGTAPSPKTESRDWRVHARQSRVRATSEVGVRELPLCGPFSGAIGCANNRPPIGAAVHHCSQTDRLVRRACDDNAKAIADFKTFTRGTANICEPHDCSLSSNRKKSQRYKE